MPTDYNTIAEQYKRSKRTPWRMYIEKFTLLELVGDLRGKSVLDLACGEGFYSREFKAQGASRVLGVDLSGRMIELARATETELPLGIEYVVADALAFRSADRFDVVAASYLLNYADSETKLVAMCDTIGRALKPGGLFVTVNNNPSHSPSRFAATRKYGFVKSIREELRPGATITYTLFQDGESFSFDNYYLSPEAHERALVQGGLREIEWVRPRLSPEWEGEPGYWDVFFEDPSVIFLRGRKPA